jgi:ATPase subunit of ABC transporter with duplicated ATPase domains
MGKKCDNYHKKATEADKTLKAIHSQMSKREKKLRTLTSENSDQRFIKGKNKESKQKADKSAMAKIKQLKSEATEIEGIQLQARREYVKPLRISGAVADCGAVATLNGVGFGYYDSVLMTFKDLNGTIGPTDKILLCGANGAGKSTC